MNTRVNKALTANCLKPIWVGFCPMAGLNVPQMVSNHWRAKGSQMKKGVTCVKLRISAANRLKVV